MKIIDFVEEHKVVDVVPAGAFTGGDEVPAGTFHGGDEVPAGTFHS